MMKLSTQTIGVLKNFAVINPNVMFQEGNRQETYTAMKNIMARATLTEEIPRPFAIYDLNMFLNALDLVEDGDIEFFDGYLTISGGRKTIMYKYADEEVIVNKPLNRDIDLGPELGNFDLSKDDLKNILKAAKILQIPEIMIGTDNGEIEMIAAKNDDPLANNYTIRMDKKAEHDIAFICDTEHMASLMPMDYNVSVRERGIHLVAENIEYYIAPKE